MTKAKVIFLKIYRKWLEKYEDAHGSDHALSSSSFLSSFLLLLFYCRKIVFICYISKLGEKPPPALDNANMHSFVGIRVWLCAYSILWTSGHLINNLEALLRFTKDNDHKDLENLQALALSSGTMICSCRRSKRARELEGRCRDLCNDLQMRIRLNKLAKKKPCVSRSLRNRLLLLEEAKTPSVMWKELYI